MKLLMLSGVNNPNVHERQAARALAETFMERHGVTLQQMRERYWDWSGLTPPRPKLGPGGRSSSGPGSGSRPGSARARSGVKVDWQRYAQPAPAVRARGAKSGESKRSRMLRRVEEAVQAALPGGKGDVRIFLPDFQDRLKGFGVRAVFHHNPLLLQELGFLEVIKLGFVVDEDPDSYAEGGRIGQGQGTGGLGLLRLLRLGLTVLPRAVTHHQAAQASLRGLAFPKDCHLLREGGHPFRISSQETLDAALMDSSGDFPGFIRALWRQGARFVVLEPERLLVGAAPTSISFEFHGDQVGAAWLGAAYTWAGLLARGLRVDPESRIHRLLLEACARWR